MNLNRALSPGKAIASPSGATPVGASARSAVEAPESSLNGIRGIWSAVRSVRTVGVRRVAQGVTQEHLSRASRSFKKLCSITPMTQYADETKSAEILNDLKSGKPKAISVRAFTRFMAMSYENPAHERLIKNVMWSWSHILQFSDKQITRITGNRDVPLDDEDGALLFHHRSYESDTENLSIFCCANGNAIQLYSQEMLDAALSMDGLLGSDLMFLLDNYVLGSDSMSNQTPFNSLENRNKIFKSASLDDSVISFLNEERFDNAEGSPVVAVAESEFIDPLVAKEAVARLIKGAGAASSTYVYTIKALLACGEVLCHLNTAELKQLVMAAADAGVEISELIDDIHEITQLFLAENRFLWS